MAAHAEHTTLPGYDAAQLLHDGCDECEYRGASPDAAIGNLDPDRFVLAWQRAGQMQLHGLSNVAVAEVGMLRALAAVQVQLERRGVPIGVAPDWRF